ncbi:MAG TPA: TadE family protein [Candidatus Dormibacteraeota bacterium]
MRTLLARFFKSQRSQGLTEMALVAPIIVFLIFGVVDFGRAIYYYVTISQAANEGARVAIIGEPPDYLQSTNSQVLAAVTNHAIEAQLGVTCTNGPIPSNPVPPVNTGYVFITAYPPSTSYEPTPRPNAPGAEQGSNPDPGVCDNIDDAAGNVPLQVTIYYNFQPITPVIQNLIGGHVILSAWAVYNTEY